MYTFLIFFLSEQMTSKVSLRSGKVKGLTSKVVEVIFISPTRLMRRPLVMLPAVTLTLLLAAVWGVPTIAKSIPWLLASATIVLNIINVSP